MHHSRTRGWLLGAAALTGILTSASPSFAADAAADASAPAADNSKVDEVVVTGSLRTQRLQDAPMAVSAVKPDEFVNSGLKNPRDLQMIAPSVQVAEQGAYALYIRGSGTNSQNGGTEQSVGMVVDGVVLGFVDDIGGDLTDLDHVEVYRGPQGTQFAKNASAGVVSIMTKNPEIGVFDGVAHASYGEHNDSSDDITANIPINDTLAARLVVGFQHRDGVFKNVAIDQYQLGSEQKSFRGKLLWQPTDRLSVLLSVDGRLTFLDPNFPQVWGQCGPAGPTTAYVNVYGTHNLPPCNGALITGIHPGPNNTQNAESLNSYRHVETGGTTAEVHYALGDFTLTSITAYRVMARHFDQPNNSGYYTQYHAQNWYNGGQASEELRLSSPADKKLTYVGGIFLYDRDTVTKSLSAGPVYGLADYLYPNTIYGTNVLVATAGGLTDSHNRNISYAGYADGSYHFTDKLQLNAGFRITQDDVYASIATRVEPGVYLQTSTPNLSPNPAVNVLPFRQLSTNHTGYTYRIGPQYFITPSIQLYGTFAHGYKGPLIDTSVNTLDAIKPEEVDMWEGGLKSSWLDHRLTANITLFHQLFKNYQVNVLNQQVMPNVFQLGNAGGMLSQGVELEFNARPVDDWLLTATMDLNDSHYTDFVTSCWNSLEPIKQATSGPNGCYVHPGATTAATNAVGTPLINSSKYVWRLEANYNHDLPGMWRVDGDIAYQWRSSWLSAPMDPNIVIPAYGILSMNAGVSTPNGKYRFGVFARNALNTFYLAGKQANSGGWTNVLDPEAVRTVGVNVTARF
jgi:iron complex outermembrane receptor protein